MFSGVGVIELDREGVDEDDGLAIFLERGGRSWSLAPCEGDSAGLRVRIARMRIVTIDVGVLLLKSMIFIDEVDRICCLQ